MKIEATGFPGLCIIAPKRFTDSRGFFAETYNRAALAAQGIVTEFVQDNHSLSSQAGVLRGLHFQAPPHAQAKLVRCGRGRLFDVAVDLRKGSPMFGSWFGLELSLENNLQLLIPAGFAHGFITRAPETEIVYKCSAAYAPEAEGSLRYDDPDLAIDWGLEGMVPTLSDKDAAAGAFAGFDSPFIYEERAP